MAGRWIEEAERPLSCARCKARIETGQRFFYARRGVYMCELDGSLAEHEEPEVGRQEAGVLSDIARLPPEAAGGTLAEAMLFLARRIDNGEVADRDISPMVKELRQMLMQLKGEFPPGDEDDDTTQARKRRERMMMMDGNFDD